MSKTVQFLKIQFCISIQFSSIWPIDRTLLVATTPAQSEPVSDSNEGVLFFFQSSSNYGTSPAYCFVSYNKDTCLRVLPFCRGVVAIFYSPSRLGKRIKGIDFLKCICLKVSVMALLKFELPYKDMAAQHITNYAYILSTMKHMYI